MRQLLKEWCRVENKKSGSLKVNIIGYLFMGFGVLRIVFKSEPDSLDHFLAFMFVVAGMALIFRKPLITPKRFSPLSFVPDSLLGFIAGYDLGDEFKEEVAEAINNDGSITFQRLQEIWDKVYPPELPSQEGRERLMRFLRQK